MKLLFSYLIQFLILFIFLKQLKAQQEIEATLAGATTSDGFLVQDNGDSPLFRVRGDGIVSIGTYAPSLASGTGLHIYGSNDATIKVEGNSTGNNNAYFNGTPTNEGDMYVTNDGDGDLYLGAGARDRRDLTIKPSGNVGINITTPDESAILEVRSTSQGFLPPRMTESQRNAISSPATGLLIYQTDGISGLHYYNGSSWEPFVSGRHYIGESYGGGTVFWVDATGQHGLISSTSDQSTSMQWYAGTNTYTMARGDGVSGGEMNTAIIIANQGNGTGSTYAARVCADLLISNYSDWYLPSKYELNLMHQQRTVIGGFSMEYYWSSTEYDNDEAWVQLFSPMGSQGGANKSGSYYVRAIRKF